MRRAEDADVAGEKPEGLALPRRSHRSKVPCLADESAGVGADLVRGRGAHPLQNLVARNLLGYLAWIETKGRGQGGWKGKRTAMCKKLEQANVCNGTEDGGRTGQEQSGNPAARACNQALKLPKEGAFPTFFPKRWKKRKKRICLAMRMRACIVHSMMGSARCAGAAGFSGGGGRKRHAETTKLA